ncbi:hypothetical protein FDECE_12183 [Fusarium decemcellulare]|nr:hypothetical protein FDECE_12183 [Fusarium decemcellulare]
MRTRAAGGSPDAPGQGDPLDMEATDQLSQHLDEERNDRLQQNLGAAMKQIAHSKLVSRLLSLDMMVKAVPSPTQSHTPSHTPSGIIGFRSIGFGQCGLIFERPGRKQVVKVARPGFHEALLIDYQAHQAVVAAFTAQKDSPECRVPQVFRHISKNEQEWWQDNKSLFPKQHSSFPLPSSALTSERILPLPKVIRDLFINEFCPEHRRQDAFSSPLNRDCLARVYLGRRRLPNQPAPMNFALRNYNLCLDQMVQLDLPVLFYAIAIGEALAIIHWKANVDGYDIEYVLGSEAEPTSEETSRKRRATRIWVLDFNLCTRWEEKVGWKQPQALIEQLVLAFFENDPYYPLPFPEDEFDEQLWLAFKDEYLRKSEEILAEKDERLHSLPKKFIKACESRERDNLMKGLGHGHRDHKG